MLWAPGQSSSGWPLPHHLVWSLAVNTGRTSSVSREIFISDRVGIVRWPPHVLPAGWLGAGGERSAAVRGNLWGPKAGSGRACPEAAAWCSVCTLAGPGDRRKLIGADLFFSKSHNIACLPPVPVISLSALSALGSCLQAFAPVWCSHWAAFLPLPWISQPSAAFLCKTFPNSLTP